MALDGSEWSTSRAGRFTPEKEPQYPLNMKPVGPQEMSGKFGENTRNLVWTRIPDIQCYLLVTLSRLPERRDEFAEFWEKLSRIIYGHSFA